MVNSIVWMIIINFTNQLLGFIRDNLVTYYYGASYITDAYVVAVIIPSVIIGVVASGLSAVFVPKCILSESEYKNGCKQYTVAMLISSCVIGIIIALIVFLFKHRLLFVFAHGFNSLSSQLAIDFLNITVLCIPFILMNNILSGYYQVKDKQLISTLVVIPSNIVGILFVCLSYYVDNIMYLPLCYVLTLLTTFLFNVWLVDISFLNIFNVKYSLISKHIRDSYRQTLPVMLGVSANQINFIIDRSLATTLFEGAITIVNISVRISSIIEVIIISSIVALYNPLLARLKNDKVGIGYSLLELFFIGFIVVIPVTIGFFIYAEDIVSILFERGGFSRANVLVCAGLLSLYSISIPFMYFKLVFCKLMYALGNTKTPVMLSLIGIAINVVLNIFLIDVFGINTLAISLLISNLVVSFIMVFYMHNRGFFVKKIKDLRVHCLPIFLFFALLSFLNEYSYSFNTYVLFFILLLMGIGYVIFSIILTRYIAEKNNYLCMFHLINKRDHHEKDINRCK